MKTKILLMIIVFYTAGLCAQTTGTKYTADLNDVATIDAIVAAVYDVLCGDQNTVRNWDRFRTLFVDDARMTSVRPDSDGKLVILKMSVEEFVARSERILSNRGFYEIEIGSVTEQFNHIAHMFSSYESRWDTKDNEPFGRGINSFQLYNDGNRWYVQSIFWEYETPDHPIPDKYVSKEK